MHRLPVFLLLFFLCLKLPAQVYDDYIGAGHDEGVTVFSSSEYQFNSWDQVAEARKTVSGEGMEGKLAEASRFLGQAALGADLATIHHVADVGMEAWMEEQFEAPVTYYLDVMEDVYDEVYQFYIQGGNDPNNFSCRPDWVESNYAWWQMTMTNEDLLRHRMALALSEILVISKENSDVRDYGYGVASFYDIFIRHAFGNYKDILLDVALHPVMGKYLSHLNNPKSIPEENIFPDENFAREVMQLFSIGLFELNEDGSRKLDNEGNYIPTYDNRDISEMARVMTGLGAGALSECGTAYEPAFWLEIRHIDMTSPMVMYENWHEQGEKILFGDQVIPAGQTGMEDVEDAMEILFNHPNVGPFIGRLLIQRLVKSNPSPEYITDVTAAFNDNGNGVRGDMKAVVKAILLHPEARECEAMMDPHNGKLKEPIIRYTQFVKAINSFNADGRYWDTGNYILANAGQHPLHSPSVFNFYLPDFQPNGPIAAANLVAPEFQIHNTKTSIGFINEAYNWTVSERLLYHWQGPLDYTDRIINTDILEYMPDSRMPEVLLNRLDLLLTHGQLTDRTRDLLREQLTAYISSSEISELSNRVKAAMFLFLLSPDYAIFK